MDTIVDTPVDHAYQENYIDSLCADLKSEEQKSVSPSTVSSNVFDLVSEALDGWTKRILDVERCYGKTQNFKKTIDESIHRQQLDGLIAASEINDIRYVADLWASLYESLFSLSIGCHSVKATIISTLLDLFTCKQLAKEQFVKCCLHL